MSTTLYRVSHFQCFPLSQAADCGVVASAPCFLTARPSVCCFSFLAVHLPRCNELTYLSVCSHLPVLHLSVAFSVMARLTLFVLLLLRCYLSLTSYQNTSVLLCIISSSVSIIYTEQSKSSSLEDICFNQQVTVFSTQY